MNSINPAPEFWDPYLSATTSPSNMDYNPSQQLNSVGSTPIPLQYNNHQQQQLQQQLLQQQQQQQQQLHQHHLNNNSNLHLQHQQQQLQAQGESYLTPPSHSGEHASVPCDLLKDDTVHYSNPHHQQLNSESPSRLYTSNVAQLDTEDNHSLKQEDCEKYLNQQHQELMNQQMQSDKKRQRTDESNSSTSNDFNENKLSPSDSSASDITNGGNTLHLTEEEIVERKKAQNRAAQRAFRERKERKLKELDAKLGQSKNENDKLLKQLEQLKQQNILLYMENEMLQRNGSKKGTEVKHTNDSKESSQMNKTNNAGVNQVSNGQSDIDKSRTLQTHGTNDRDVDMDEGDVSPRVDSQGEEQKFTFPITREAFITKVTEDHSKDFFTPVSDLQSLAYEADNGEEVLTVSAVWDYLNSLSSEYDELDFNIPQIMQELKGNERCHGYGPAYSLNTIHEVIKKNVG